MAAEKSSEFFSVTGTEEVLRVFDGLPPLESEAVPLRESGGRILASDVTAVDDLPHFDRSTMDGFAVVAADTFGCSDSQPAYLTCTGGVEMGKPAAKGLRPGETLRISTGGMIPAGADAVVMWEFTRETEDLVEVCRPAAPGEHIARAGEDVRGGETILRAGRRLRPADVGLLSGLGVTAVPVRRRPRVAVISTGDELVAPGERPAPGKIRNVNQYSLGAWIDHFGGESVLMGVVPDELERITEVARQGLEENHMVIISGGSSRGARDLTRQVVSSCGDPGLLFHGLAVKPGKPTVVGACGDKPVFGLPGHPVSAMVVFLVLVRPVLNRLLGLDREAGLSKVPARLGDNLPSAAGREDYYQVRIERDGRELVAKPVFRKSGLVSAMVMGEGMVRVPAECEGLETGAPVEVEIYR